MNKKKAVPIIVNQGHQHLDEMS